METPILVAIIAATASAITFFLTKMKEREAEWRKLHIEQYRELISAMGEATGNDIPEASKKRLALAANHVALFASSNVLRHLTTLLDAVSTGRTGNHDEVFTALMCAIRTDLKVPGSDSQTDIRFKLWAPGRN